MLGGGPELIAENWRRPYPLVFKEDIALRVLEISAVKSKEVKDWLYCKHYWQLKGIIHAQKVTGSLPRLYMRHSQKDFFSEFQNFSSGISLRVSFRFPARTLI